MKSFLDIARRCHIFLWLAFVVAVVLAAITISVVRLWLPEAGHHREDIQRWMTEYTGLPVTIGAIDIQWRGLRPRLALKDICLKEKQGARAIVCFREAQLTIDLAASAWRGRPEPSGLTVAGANLTVVRRADGSFTVEGLEDMPPDSRLQEQLQEWLLGQKYLVIKDSQLHWRDLRTGRVRHFSNVRLDLRNSGQRHRLAGAVTLPARGDGKPVPGVTEGIVFALDLTGDVFAANGWSGKGYVSATGVDLAQWLEGRAVRGITADSGIADVKLWGEWKQATLRRLEGEGVLHDVRLTGAETPLENTVPAPSLSISTLSGRFIWRRQAQGGWVLDADRVVMARAGVQAPPAARLKVAVTQFGPVTVVETGFDRLRLQDAAPMLMLGDAVSGPLREAIAALRPHGDLHDAYINYRGSEGAAPSYLARGHFEDLAIAHWKHVPAVSGLSGALRMNEHSGALVLDSKGTRFEFGTLFRGPLSADTLNGHLAWRRQDGGWRIQSHDLALHNADLSGRVSAVVDVPENGASPFIDLVASAGNANLEHISRYLPVGVIPPKVVAWLDRSIISGRATSVSAVLHGRVKDFPYDRGTGRFEVRFDVSDGILDYEPGWPRIEEIETEVVFDGRGMRINAVGGKIFTTTINSARVAIADLEGSPPVLTIAGAAQGPLADGLRFIRESPLHESTGMYLDKARAEGHGALDLNLRIPLSAEHPDQIKGALAFDNNTLIFADGDLELSQVNGVLGFSESALSARGIRARLLGQQAEINVDTVAAEGPAKTPGDLLFEARGKSAASALARQFKSPLLKHLEGEAEWLATLRIHETRNRKTAAALRVESSLKGMAVLLPAPLGKPAAQPAAFAVTTEFPRARETPFSVRYGDNLQAVFTLTDEGGVDRGELRFGGGAAVLPGKPGIHIVGAVARLPGSDWLAFFKADADVLPAAREHEINSIDLRIGELEVFRQRFDKLDLHAENTAQAWEARLDSAGLAGRLRFPHAPSAPVTADLERLMLQAMPAGEAVSGAALDTDPRQIPPLRIQAKRFSYAGIELGGLALTAVPRPAGLHVDSLAFNSDALKINATGDWNIDKGRQSSAFSIALDSSDLEKTFILFNHPGTMENGAGRIDSDIRWNAPPHAFSFDKLNGNVRLNFRKGRLLGVEPGAGRVFGLLGTLNFNDLFSKGFTFDRIEGEFSIKDGNAQTDNLTMEGPAAKVEIKGRVGLAAKDYDHRVTVIPRSSTTLPLAGALAGGLPMGAAVLLFQKLFQPGLDRLTRYQYTVKGSWDNPVIDVPPQGKKEDASGDKK